jgi:hypothetical protein
MPLGATIDDGGGQTFTETINKKIRKYAQQLQAKITGPSFTSLLYAKI